MLKEIYELTLKPVGSRKVVLLLFIPMIIITVLPTFFSIGKSVDYYIDGTSSEYKRLRTKIVDINYPISMLVASSFIVYIIYLICGLPDTKDFDKRKV